MIDPNQETLLSLTQTAKELPVRRGGKRAHVSCVYRWTKAGCKGVILESIQVGGTRCTSREALARFFDRLTDRQSVSVPTSSKAHNRPVETAEQLLDDAGI